MQARGGRTARLGATGGPVESFQDLSRLSRLSRLKRLGDTRRRAHFESL